MTQQMLGMAYSLISGILFTVVVVVIIVQGFGAYKAKMSLTREEAYRKLAEQSTSALQKTVDEQQKTNTTLESMSTRLAAIEKILREVE
jgi:cell division protein FtsB